jgi:hypothetical protein
MVAECLASKSTVRVDSRFSAVREVFCENFARGELGAACAVLLDGEGVVDV